MSSGVDVNRGIDVNLSARMALGSLARRRWAGLAIALLGASSGCVVSTSGGPAAEPVVPGPPRDETADAGPVNRGGPVEIGARHILISYRGASRAAPYVERSKEEARAHAEALREQIIAGADFGELAKKESDDRGSAAAGGELGTFRREQMVPTFSDAAFALDVGGVADVVESQFGFHVIQRTE